MNEFLSWFKDLMEKNIIIRGLIAVIVLCTVCYMMVTGQEVSGEMWGLLGTVLGFYFGGTKVVSRV